MKVYRHSQRSGQLVPAEDMAVELIELGPDGHPHAIVSIDGDPVEVTRKSGSWTTEPDEAGVCRGILPEYAAALQIAARGVVLSDDTESVVATDVPSSSD